MDDTGVVDQGEDEPGSNEGGAGGAAGGRGGGGNAAETPAGGKGGDAPDAGSIVSPSTPDAQAGGTGGQPAPTADGGTPPAPAGPRKQAVIAVGYGGLRLFSMDGGRTWGKRVVIDPNGGDDKNLIRGAGYGDGVWVAVGWKIFTSEDGVNWNEIPDDVVPGNWYDCVNYKDGKFIAQPTRDGYGSHIESTDRGKTWRKGSGSVRCQSQGQGDARPVFKLDGHELSTGFRGKILFDKQLIYTDACCQIRNFEVGLLPTE